MPAQSASELILNIVPIAFSRETFKMGRLAYTDDDAYRDLRERHWKTHVFRYDSRSGHILNLAMAPSDEPLGQVEDANINEHLLLAARAVQHAILVWISTRLHIVKANKQLVFWGQADETLLLARALDKVGLVPIPGLEVPLRYEIDCRMFHHADNQLYLGLVINVETANVIDIPVAELMEKGLPIVGHYVCRRRDTEHVYLHPGLDNLGRVSSVEGSRLLLTDTDGITEAESNQVLLEPRLEYLHEVIRTLCGHKAPRVLSALQALRQPVSTPIGQLAQIRITLAGLRRKKEQLTIANGVKVELGEMLQEEDDRFPAEITTERPTLLFGPQGRNSGTVPDNGIKVWGPYMYMQNTRNTPLIAVICESQYRGQVEQFTKALCDGLPDELWKGVGDNPYRGGLIGKFRTTRIRLEYEECSSQSSQDYKVAARKLLERLPETPDLALVQIRESFKNQRGDNNAYFVTKAALMSAGVPVQSVCIEKMDTSMYGTAYLLNNVALASYAKLDGIPWVMATPGPTTHELVMGIGATEVGEGRLGARRRYIGITTVFQGDGRYLLWGLTREVLFDDYPSALLESLRTVIRHVKDQNGWQDGDRVRLICHVYKRLKDCEVQAIKKLVGELAADKFTVEFAFLDISWSHPYRLINPSEKGVAYGSGNNKPAKGVGVPERGICLQLDRWRTLLHLTGPRDVKTETQGLPRPLLIELHQDSDFTDMTYLSRQIYHFAYISWRSFFPATEPVTIKYSRLVASLLGNLKTVSDWDSTVLSIGSLRGRRWFL